MLFHADVISTSVRTSKQYFYLFLYPSVSLLYYVFVLSTFNVYICFISFPSLFFVLIFSSCIKIQQVLFSPLLPQSFYSLFIHFLFLCFASNFFHFEDEVKPKLHLKIPFVLHSKHTSPCLYK